MTAHLYEEIEMLTAERDYYRDQVRELTSSPAPGIYRLGFTPQECRILGLLMRRKGLLCSHEAVIIAADTAEGKDAVRTARVAVAKIRKKLKALEIEEAISKRNPLGYVMCPAAAETLQKKADRITYEQIRRTLNSSRDSKLVTGQSESGEHIFCSA